MAKQKVILEYVARGDSRGCLMLVEIPREPGGVGKGTGSRRAEQSATGLSGCISASEHW